MLKEFSKGHLFMEGGLKRTFLLFLLVAVYVNMLFPPCIFESRLAEVLGVGRRATMEGKCQWNNFKHDPIPDDSLDVLKFPLRPCKQCSDWSAECL